MNQADSTCHPDCVVFFWTEQPPSMKVPRNSSKVVCLMFLMQAVDVEGQPKAEHHNHKFNGVFDKELVHRIKIQASTSGLSHARCSSINFCRGT